MPHADHQPLRGDRPPHLMVPAADDSNRDNVKRVFLTWFIIWSLCILDDGRTVTLRDARQTSIGFSLLEMMAVIDLILILASFSMPMYHSIVVRGREAVLRDQLLTLRAQIDRFTHDYARGPESLDELVDKEYLGAVPVDPFTGSSETWQLDTETTSLSVDGSDTLGITDVHSGSADTGLDGTAYSSW